MSVNPSERPDPSDPANHGYLRQLAEAPFRLGVNRFVQANFTKAVAGVMTLPSGSERAAVLAALNSGLGGMSRSALSGAAAAEMEGLLKARRPELAAVQSTLQSIEGALNSLEQRFTRMWGAETKAGRNPAGPLQVFAHDLGVCRGTVHYLCRELLGKAPPLLGGLETGCPSEGAAGDPPYPMDDLLVLEVASLPEPLAKMFREALVWLEGMGPTGARVHVQGLVRTAARQALAAHSRDEPQSASSTGPESST